MYLTQKNNIKKLKKREYMILRLLAKMSKNLFNVTNYTIREYFKRNNKYLRYQKDEWRYLKDKN